MNKPSGSKYSTSSELVKTGPGILKSVHLTPAAAIATVTVYDEVSGTGDIITKLSAVANGQTQKFEPEGGVVFGVGCYVAITGAGAVVTTVYV